MDISKEISDEEILREGERRKYSSPRGPNRYICDVFDEMRKCNETRNYSYLLGLIEEAQTMVNRMETRLSDKYDYYTLRKKLLDEISEDKEVKDLGKKIKLE